MKGRESNKSSTNGKYAYYNVGYVQSLIIRTGKAIRRLGKEKNLSIQQTANNPSKKT